MNALWVGRVIPNAPSPVRGKGTRRIRDNLPYRPMHDS